MTEAVQRFIDSHPVIDGSPEAAAALAAAEAIDSARSSRSSGAAMQGEASMMGRLLDTLERLRSMAPDAAEVSPLDEIRARRDAKLGRAAS